MSEADAGITRAGWELRPQAGGPVIRGDLRFLADTEPDTAVVICHGFEGFKDWAFFPELARSVASRGHAAVSFNFSHSGIGADPEEFTALGLFAEGTHTRNVAEIHAVLEMLAAGRLLRRPPRRIGLVGHSRGGGEAVLAAAESDAVDALVTWSAIASVERWSAEQVAAWRLGETVHVANARTGQQMPMGPGFWEDIERNRERLDILGAAARLAAPWLIVHGEADEAVAVDDARRLHEAAAERTELLLVAEAGHTFGARHPFEGVGPHLRLALEATLRWFDVHLAPSSDQPADREG